MLVLIIIEQLLRIFAGKLKPLKVDKAPPGKYGTYIVLCASTVFMFVSNWIKSLEIPNFNSPSVLQAFGADDPLFVWPSQWLHDRPHWIPERSLIPAEWVVLPRVSQVLPQYVALAESVWIVNQVCFDLIVDLFGKTLNSSVSQALSYLQQYEAYHHNGHDYTEDVLSQKHLKATRQRVIWCFRSNLLVLNVKIEFVY